MPVLDDFLQDVMHSISSRETTDNKLRALVAHLVPEPLSAYPIMCHVCTGLEDKRMACKLASSHLQDRSQQVQELATISEPRARYMITPVRASVGCI